MEFNSLRFALFFLIFLAGLLILPRKLRKYWLLAGNCLFYLSWNRPAFLLLLISALLTWLCGLRLEKTHGKRIYVMIPVIWILGLLIFFKFGSYVDPFFRRAGAAKLISARDIIVPLGLAFYTLRCISYTVDIRRGKLAAEKNPLDVLIYVSFFPQIISGPIERPGKFFGELAAFTGRRGLSPERIRSGFLLIFWGLFQKLVLAERLAMITVPLFDSFESRGFWELLIAAAAYALQIYTDFSGYSDMSRGIAEMMGFSTMRNFRQPYFAADDREFWRRWHISLSSWLTDYIYIPLGGSRKGRVRKYINIVTVFLVSALWHGSTLNYIFWGLLHASVQILQDLWQRTGKHLPARIAHILTLAVMFFTLIFFNSGGLNRGFRILRRMFSDFSLPLTADFGISSGNLAVLLSGLLILLFVDLLHERGTSIRGWADSLPLPVRWALFLGLLWTVIMLGIYGVGYETGSFIYSQF